MLWRNRELNNTCTFYYSDNGYHMCSHALPDTGRRIGGESTLYTEDIQFPL